MFPAEGVRSPMHEVTRSLKLAVLVGAGVVLFGVMSAQGSTQQGAEDLDKAAGTGQARTLRNALIARVGDLDRLRVPATNDTLPQPTLENGSVDPRYQITEAKRYLGKLLFFDPVRTTRIHTEFGGLESTARTGSCGSCHLGE